MPKVTVLVGLIALVAAPCFAQAPGAVPVNLAAVLGLSEEAAPLFLAGGGTGSPSSVTCTATCGTDPSVSCTVSSGTCTAVNRNCPERGHVTCGATTTYCSAICPQCTEGTMRTFATGGCCDTDLIERERDRCISGRWQFESFLCGPTVCSFAP